MKGFIIVTLLILGVVYFILGVINFIDNLIYGFQSEAITKDTYMVMIAVVIAISLFTFGMRWIFL